MFKESRISVLGCSRIGCNLCSTYSFRVSMECHQFRVCKPDFDVNLVMMYFEFRSLLHSVAVWSCLVVMHAGCRDSNSYTNDKVKASSEFQPYL